MIFGLWPLYFVLCLLHAQRPKYKDQSPSSAKYFNHFFDRFSQHVYFLFRIVKSERRARGRRDLEVLHYRLRTMMTSTNGYTLLIQDRADVVRMNVLDGK